MNGSGTTNISSVYEFWDRSLGKTGNRYYRLKQVDMDGEFEYSPIKLVAFNDIDIKVTAYPNPFINYLKLHYTSEEVKVINVQLVDVNGQIIKKEQHQVNIGEQDILLDIPNDLPSGNYFIQLPDDQNIPAIRLSKIRM